jgi:acetylornithine deacetylase/succinyl-diaminopimelate desuccinylase-like protein
MTTEPTSFEAFDRLVEARLDRWSQELVEFLAIASEGGDDAGLRRAADWTADRLRRLGASVEVLEIDGAPPLVVGEIGDGPRTLSAVQHYDVQPASPLELWTTPPYEPAIRDGRIWARGATDNKGEFLPRVWAVEAWLEAIGPLPVRVRYLVEGQEETGSGALDALLDLRPHLREADAALIEGGALDLRDKPGVAAGGKGITVVDLNLRTMRVDSHSSVSRLLPNAGARMAAALATLWDAEGRPAVKGLDDGVRPPTPAQRATAATTDLRDLDDLLEHQGLAAFVGGIAGVDAVEAMTFEPTLNLQGLWAGHIEATPKTVIPAEAHARIDMRMVPDQRPEHVVGALRRHLDEHGFADVEIVAREGEPAWWTPTDHPLVVAAGSAAQDVTGQAPDYYVSMAGTVPMFQVCAQHRVPVTTLGAARDDCDAHAPDENIRIGDLALATRITGRFLARFAALPEVPRVV